MGISILLDFISNLLLLIPAELFISEDILLIIISVILSIIIISIIAFVRTLITMGVTKISLKFSNNEEGEYEDLISCYPLFFKYLASSIVYMLIMMGGLLLLIIPGIIWAIQFQFYNYFIIDKGLGPIEALKSSSRITKGVKWKLLGFLVVILLINLVGALALVIGLFATIPTSMVAVAFVYRKLSMQTKPIKPIKISQRR
ncbi:MAG: hypothetical protein QGF74_03165 [Candidatus Nanoarchaeia archaeon]|jgi:uncharacterized membrane protein|nr:hypothetical protein [Candidatus Nanoarchaeia archaeon]|tara:strand:+ start:17032 stop:17634 length:603 start_codon:yes stop_codon:yes gene_type:complete